MKTRGGHINRSALPDFSGFLARSCVRVCKEEW